MSKFNDRKWRRELIELSEGASPKEGARRLIDKLVQSKLLDKKNEKKAMDLLTYLMARGIHEGKLNEGVKENMLKAIPDSYNYDKLAKDVADIIKEEYGSHNIKPFIKSITKYLK
tara:strand:+ start:358 stop:702 length:345 start_codon:yes stop_codon:yes gene_type:complete